MKTTNPKRIRSKKENKSSLCSRKLRFLQWRWRFLQSSIVLSPKISCSCQKISCSRPKKIVFRHYQFLQWRFQMGRKVILGFRGEDQRRSRVERNMRERERGAQEREREREGRQKKKNACETLGLKKIEYGWADLPRMGQGIRRTLAFCNAYQLSATQIGLQMLSPGCSDVRRMGL